MKRIVSIIMLIVLPLAGCATKPATYNWNVCEYKDGELVVRDATSKESRTYEKMHEESK